jgi:hypothetical protein
MPSVFLSNHRAPFRAASVEIIGGGILCSGQRPESQAMVMAKTRIEE